MDSRAIKKNNLRHDVICYRGMDIDPTLGAESGDLIKPGQFYSTSVIESRSFGSDYKIVIYAKKGTKAAYVEDLSYFKAQRELLLDKDCVYRVVSRKGNVIQLGVI